MNRATIALYEGAPHGGGFRDFVADARVTMLGVIPSIVRAWRHGGLYENPGWDAVRTFSSTGEPSSQEDYLWLMSRAGYRAPVIEYLGGTEIGGGHITGSLVQPASPATFTTPALGIDLVILDEEGRPVAEGGSGELFLVPPAIGLSQHLLNADHGAIYDEGAPAGPGGAPLRRHGDRIARLHGGFYKAQGRVDDAMNLGGIKISSMEIERAAATHPAVSECAAVAVQPGGDGAERLVIFAVCPGTAAPGPAGAGARPRGTAQTRAPDPDAPEAGAPTGNPAHSRSPDPATLRAEIGTIIARDLNRLFRVHDLVIVDALPRTASHKVMRRELRERYVHRSQPR
jgi:acetyl-CoA synthetase